MEKRTYLSMLSILLAAMLTMPLLGRASTQSIQMEDLTSYIENNDFEYSQPGVKNPSGNIARGIPTGWTAYVKRGSQEWWQTIADGVNTTALPNQSYGINQGANDIHGINVFWVNTTPMPDAFKLYQTIPAEKLGKGRYRVMCKLSCVANKLTNVRLYANNYSQYYGYASDYDANIATDEIYTFAGYPGCSGNDGDFHLLDMSVDVELADGEDLELGIKSSCYKINGTKATDNSGWFKVDYFQLYRLNVEEEESGNRTITSFRDYRLTIGSSHTLDGVTYSEPDIYYTDNGDGTYHAIRLTVTPDETPAAMTAPYLNEATDHSMQVCWKTKSTVSNATVRYGTSPEALTTQQSIFTTRQITSSYYWHTVQLTGLQPNTVYYYQLVSDGNESGVCRFRTMPSADNKQPFRILMIGDHQRNERSDYEWLLRMAKRTLDQKYGKAELEDNVRLLMNVGDQVDSGSVRQYEFTHLYKSREVMSHLPIMTAVGNHELFKDSELNLYKGHYASYGDIEYKGIKSGTALYYAYQAGPVLFVVMNTDGTSDEQKQWVKRVVQAADNDATVRFIVSVQHRPLYAEQWASDTNPWMTNEVMPILSASRKHVLNCAGHHHLYARGQMTQWPVYHMISGGGVGTSAQDYEQLWGKTPDNRNRDEVQKTIDQWTYQIMEFNPVTDEMTVETYSIGNSRLALDNVLIDRFSRKLTVIDKPATPVLSVASGSVALPATISQATAVESLHSSEYQIARDAGFKDIVYQRILLFEDFYDVDASYLPKNVRDGLPVTSLSLSASDLPSGNYFIRCRNRSMNLDWSDYSEAKAITVTGSTVAAVRLDHRFYKPGQTVEVHFNNAPVGKDAWVGIYAQGKHPGTSDVSYAYQYTPSASGTLTFTINDANEYFAVLFGDGGYNEVSSRVSFVVTDYATDEQPPVLSLEKQSYTVGEPVKVSFSHAPALKNDWIGIYKAGQAPVDSKSLCYLYTNQQAEGSVTLNVEGNNNFTSALPEGDYFVCYFMADGYTEATERLPFTVTKATADGLMLQQGNVVIVVPDGECSQVRLAVQALQRDFEKVLGFKPAIVSALGTTDGVELVVANDAVGGLPVGITSPLSGFEPHHVYADAANRRIYLQGADMRGTIYAIYTLSEKILGVPPLWYWCDWQPEQKSSIDVAADYDYYQPSPTVRYRAWFPNDEDLFVPWRRKSTDNNERWLETMLRLKLNTVEYTATVTTNGTLNGEAMLYKKYGLVLTSHHMIALNNSFANWDAYWQQVRKTTPPALSVNDMTSLREFWQYNINSVMNSGVENLWQVAFRGKTDQPFWSVFTDAPSTDAERAAVINRMVKEQYDMICQSTGEENPFVRMTFYDEISSLLAAGYLQPPTATNMLWTFVAGRRDHYPYDDLVNWTNTNNVKLGYYMNLQFYSTGAHLAPAEGPWKMEDNYRYVQTKGPLTFSVVNAGNVREFLMEMSANAAMMWNSPGYNTNDFMRQFCAQYFGEEHAAEAAQLYHDYYYAYWNPKKSDFPGGFDRQYVFQDLRHSQVIKQINNTWNTFKVNPFTEIGYESVPGRTFRIEGRNPVDSVLAGMSREMVAFGDVARRCEALQSQIPSGKAQFFYDHLSAYAHYMEQLSTAVYHYVYAYKNKDDDRYGHLKTAYEAMKAAKAALVASEHGVFDHWYDTDDKFEMDARIEAIRARMKENEVEDLTLTEQLIENYDFEYNHECQLNAVGNIGRGIPCGWESKGELKKGANGLDSYGVNQGAANYHGNNVCWMNSVPMPDEFWLYQTIPASKLTPGKYRVCCKLWVEVNKKTNCRLFANQNVQYYGYDYDYTNLLTPGEVNTYAGYAGGSTDNFELRDMEVTVDVAEGEDLTIGIKTSNQRNNGERSTSDNAGWFKVDFFRIHKMDETTGIVDNNREPITNNREPITMNHEPITKNHYYDLQGRPIINGTLHKGLYIQDGRIVVK